MRLGASMPDWPSFRPEELLATLNDHGVAYVVIGGIAAVLHGSPLRTDDADICPAHTLENLERLAAALAELDARIALPEEPEGVDFPHDPEVIGRVEIWNLITRFGRFDLSFCPSGTGGYEDLRRRAEILDLGEGVEVPVASLLDVIRSKEAAGRAKDRRMLPTLRRLLEDLDEEEQRGRG